jgi:hypothetical protein
MTLKSIKVTEFVFRVIHGIRFYVQTFQGFVDFSCPYRKVILALI